MTLNPFFSKNSFKVLDLCSSIGIVGIHMYEKLKNLGYDTEVTFVDINKERLTHIPKKPDFKIINGDALKVDVKQKFDVVVLRYALYYFTKEEILLLLNKIYGFLDNGGLFIIISFGNNDDNITNFFTKLHHKIFEIKQIPHSENRVYPPIYDIAEMLMSNSFLIGNKSMELSVWSDSHLAKKYTLEQEHLDYLKQFIETIDTSLKKSINLRNMSGSLVFNIPIFSINAIKT